MVPPFGEGLIGFAGCQAASDASFSGDQRSSGLALAQGLLRSVDRTWAKAEARVATLSVARVTTQSPCLTSLGPFPPRIIPSSACEVLLKTGEPELPGYEGILVISAVSLFDCTTPGANFAG